MTHALKQLVVAVGFAAAAVLSASADRTDPLLPIYVDPDLGSDDNDGKSWETAVKTISHANSLTETSAYYNERRCQIILKAGVYVFGASEKIELAPRASIMGDPEHGRGDTVLTTDGAVRTAALLLFGSKNDNYINCVANLTISNVVMEGGYAPVRFGFNGVDLDYFPHVLSNCVMTCCQMSSSSALCSSGVYMDSYSLLTDCEFSCLTNKCGTGASAAVMRFQRGRVERCTFHGCRSAGSGAILSWYADSAEGQLVRDCTFTDNYAYYSGGGVVDVPHVVGCTFVNNSSDYHGGAYYGGGRSDFNASSPLIENCTFISNSVSGTSRHGGAMQIKSGCGLVTNCTFVGNSCKGDNGGALYYAAQVVDCDFLENHAAVNGGALCSVGHVVDCEFAGNSAAGSGGAASSASDVVSCRFAGNSAANGGALYCPTTVSNCLFVGNAATTSGGAIHMGTSGSKSTDRLVVDSVITNNTAGGGGNYVGGGGIMIWSDGSDSSRILTLRNCLVVDNAVTNSSGCGSGAILMGRSTEASIVVESCTFVGNRATKGSAGGVYVWPNSGNDATYFTNTIIAANFKSDGSYASALTSVYGSQQKMVDNLGYCLIHPAQSGSVADDQHVINTGTPPRFRRGTFVPSPRSPAVNAGLVFPWMAGAYDLQRDAAGNPTTPRVYGAGVDMGAFEYMPTDGFIFLFN